MSDHLVWQLRMELPTDIVGEFMDILEEGFLSSACFEIDEENWELRLYSDVNPDIDDKIQILSTAFGIKSPNYVIEQVPNIDWVAESQKSFKPITAGKFYVYPSWNEEKIPEDKIPIEIDPACAFGTGNHESTQGCLMALDSVPHKPSKILDLGCGSGILAIAAAKLWPDVAVDAVDNHKLSVKTAIENAEKNSVKIRVMDSDGYGVVLEKYDLIMANILAPSLIELAPLTISHLKSGGIVILSGILKNQAQDVIKAHNSLTLLREIEMNNWSTITLRKD